MTRDSTEQRRTTPSPKVNARGSSPPVPRVLERSVASTIGGMPIYPDPHGEREKKTRRRRKNS